MINKSDGHEAGLRFVCHETPQFFLGKMVVSIVNVINSVFGGFGWVGLAA